MSEVIPGAIFMLCAFALIVLFWGEPDLHDALISATGSADKTKTVCSRITPEGEILFHECVR